MIPHSWLLKILKIYKIITDNNAESGKVPRIFQRFHVEWQKKSSQKGISLILNRLIPR
jgi:hypothetical protein